MFIIILFLLGCVRLSGLLSFVPALLFSTLTPLFLLSSSVPLSYFSLAVPMRDCLGKHSCMSSPFPIAILNGTSFFFSLWCKRNGNKPSGHYYMLCSCSDRSNHLINKKKSWASSPEDRYSGSYCVVKWDVLNCVTFSM